MDCSILKVLSLRLAVTLIYVERNREHGLFMYFNPGQGLCYWSSEVGWSLIHMELLQVGTQMTVVLATGWVSSVWTGRCICCKCHQLLARSQLLT